LVASFLFYYAIYRFYSVLMVSRSLVKFTCEALTASCKLPAASCSIFILAVQNVIMQKISIKKTLQTVWCI